MTFTMNLYSEQKEVSMVVSVRFLRECFISVAAGNVMLNPNTLTIKINVPMFHIRKVSDYFTYSMC